MKRLERFINNGVKVIFQTLSANLPIIQFWHLVHLYCNGNIPVCLHDVSNIPPVGGGVQYQLTPV